MFDSFNNATVLVFALGAFVVLAIAVPLLLWLLKKLKAQEARSARLAAEAEEGREILAAAPDGLFLWDHTKNEERCSRRLAVLLGLKAGTSARLEDVLAKFAAPEVRILKRSIDQLHQDGASFDLLLKLDERTIQATGARASSLNGRPLDDLMWMRDVTNEANPQALDQAQTNTGGNVTALDHFDQLLNTLPIPIWIRDGNLNVVFSNSAETHMAASRDSDAQARQARDENRTVTKCHHDIPDKTGATYEVSEVPARDWSGTIGFALERGGRSGNAGTGLAHDQVLDNLSTAIAIFGANRRLVFSNGAYASLWRFDPAWLAEEPSLNEILERLRERRQLPEVTDFRAFKEQQAALFNSLSGPKETLLHLPDGRTLRAVVSAHAPGGLVFSYEDVSDRLDLERSFKTLNAVQRETLDNLYEGIAVFGSDGKLKLSNPAFSALWGLSETATMGEPHLSEVINATRALTAETETLNDEEWQAHVNTLVAQYTGRHVANGRIHLSNGSILDFSSVPLPDGAVLLSYLNVTDSARLEAALRQRAEALAQANRLKSEFIADVSFEVRTPLTTLRGFADILAQEYFGKLNRRQMEYCQGILDSSLGLSNVINDILDMASIEAGTMTLELDTVEIHSMLASVLNLVNERARRKSLDIDFDCPSDIGWIVADEKRLKQVLFYLLSNAVTISPPRGTVRLQARRIGENEDAFVSFTVTGQIEDVKQAEQLDIFQPFERPANAAAATGVQMGTGLGLTLVQRFVDLHGGEVEVNSPQGKETTITCRLPATGAKRDSKADLSVVGG